MRQLKKRYIFLVAFITILGWFSWWLLRRDYACETDSTVCEIYDLSSITNEKDYEYYSSLNKQCEKQRTTCNLLILFDAL
jgi:hypothetical protein